MGSWMWLWMGRTLLSSLSLKTYIGQRAGRCPAARAGPIFPVIGASRRLKAWSHRGPEQRHVPCPRAKLPTGSAHWHRQHELRASRRHIKRGGCAQRPTGAAGSWPARVTARSQTTNGPLEPLTPHPLPAIRTLSTVSGADDNIDCLFKSGRSTIN